MKIKVKIPAKVNLTLDVFKCENGFHNINSVVSSIDVFDTISVRPRKDYFITLKMKGIKVDCEEKQNNAYITAQKFMERFDTLGVDIVIDKKIPVGAGLGGSSADICGVVKAMCKLFNVEEGKEVINLVNSLGSDCNYMLNGGYALLSGRGEKIEKINSKRVYYYIVLPESESVSAKDCYKTFDNMQIENIKNSNALKENLISGKDIFEYISNDLYLPATQLCPKITQNITIIGEHGKSLMTGSGSAVLSIFNSKKDRDNAFKLLTKKYGKKFIKAQTV